MKLLANSIAAILFGGVALNVLAEEGLEVGAPHVDPSIHINQVALEDDGPKVAIVELADNTQVRNYRVLKDGVEVASGKPMPLSRFSEWGEGRRYYEIDFSRVKDAGSYRIEVSFDEGVLTSAPVVVGDDAVFDTTVSAVLSYFDDQRHTGDKDRKIRIYDTDRYVNVYGGWKDAGGETGKYLSHLSYANFMNPQQGALTPWVFAKAYENVPEILKEKGVDKRFLESVMWGADFLSRSVDPEGYLYMTVFDKWGTPGAERVITGYIGLDGVYTENFQASFREGGGMAIAALARAARLSKETGITGEVSAEKYQADAVRAFAHLQKFGPSYCDDGKENLIDDYAALLAASELYRTTGEMQYLKAARIRASNINGRLTPEGWFISDDTDRPFFHAADAGTPMVALVEYLAIETDAEHIKAAKETLKKALEFQLQLTNKVPNPFQYARQVFKTYDFEKKVRNAELKEGFFVPHANETGYWWQGESARLSSLAVAAIAGGRLVAPDEKGAFGVKEEFARFAQHQLDWTLGRNPYDMSMLTGFGVKNPPYSESGGPLVVGGIANGVTGHHESDEGRGIIFAPGPDHNNWRWAEQWLPHSTWFLLAMTTMADDITQMQ